MRQHFKQIAGSSIVYGLGGLSNQILGFFLVPVYCHIIPVSEYGKLTYFNLIVSVLTMLMVFGMVSSLYRYYPEFEKRNEQRQLTGTILTSILTGGLIFAAVLLALSGTISTLLFDSTLEKPQLQLVAATGFVTSINGLFLGIMRYKGYATKFISISIGKTIIALSLNIFTVVVLKNGVPGILLSTFLSELLALFLLVLINRRWITFSFDRQIFVRAFRFGAPGIMASAGSYLLSYTGVYFLKSHASLDVVGQYGFALKFSALVMIFVVDPFDQAWNPIKFRYLENPDHDLIFSRILDYLILISSYLALAISIAMPEVVGILASSDYHPAANFVPVLALSVVLYGAYRVSTLGSEIAEKTHWRSTIVLLSGLLNLGLNTWMAPRWGVVGILISLVISYLLLFMASMYYSQRCFHIGYSYIRNLQAVAVMAVTYWISTLDIHPQLLRLPFKFGLIVTPALLLWMIGYFHETEKRLIREILKAIKDRDRSVFNLGNLLR